MNQDIQKSNKAKRNFMNNQQVKPKTDIPETNIRV